MEWLGFIIRTSILLTYWMKVRKWNPINFDIFFLCRFKVPNSIYLLYERWPQPNRFISQRSVEFFFKRFTEREIFTKETIVQLTQQSRSCTLFHIIFRFLIIALPNLSICGHIALSIQNAAKTFITYLDFQLQIMRKRSHLKVIQAVKYSFVTLLISNSLDKFPTCHTHST